jgi:hypothetical protein
MSESGKARLLSLLSGSERELVNIKFFPGDAVTSGDELAGAVHDALVQGLADGAVEIIPTTGLSAVPSGSLVAGN